ncbi:hypothetical protein T440DRAFT_390664 [Plenodomus tracheiphilus IPT5]|uniref:Uncharacterized protein n=1 Tax=Plenodomus tracheiphilus IPT5 TaxID=1408161 RepID=A0A6A7BF65_9PLEO|nr:hypothetical protein T440DRAFT_390664 [Plenodomus tracheiphilus IPT5]
MAFESYPPCHFNLATNTTLVVETARGCHDGATSNIYYADQTSRVINIIIV